MTMTVNSVTISGNFTETIRLARPSQDHRPRADHCLSLCANPFTRNQQMVKAKAKRVHGRFSFFNTSF